jgi:hydrogenase-4 component F
MTLHSLTKSGIFFTVGHIAQAKGTQRIANIGGLTATHPVLGWGLVAGVAAIAGLPPFGVFMSEVLIVSATFHTHPVLAVILVLGLLLAFGALLMRATDMAFGDPRGVAHPVHASHLPAIAHFGLVLMAGLWLPPPLVAWFTHVAALLG